jgi:hypothetical protein
MEEPRDGLNQHGIGRACLETTRLFERQDPLDPAVTLPTRGPLRALAPEDAASERPFGPVVGGCDPMVGKKDPERIHLAEQAADKLPCVVLPLMILVNQFAEARVPRPPLAPRGRGGGHMTETLQLGECPCPTGRQVGIIPRCQTSGTADEMG